MKKIGLRLCLATIAFSAIAAVPPDVMNYQGVLRSAAGDPLNGNYDMVFRFYDAELGGNELLVDTHDAIGGNAISVDGGMFNAELGGGSVTDGSGPGVYTTLAEVFRDYGNVWLGIQVGTEVLSPRIRVRSAGYAHNAGSIDGRLASEFIDTSSTPQTKNGSLTLDGGAGRGLFARGADEGGYFEDTDGTSRAWLASGTFGVTGRGTAAGGSFVDIDGSGKADIGVADIGIDSFGDLAGGVFTCTAGSGYAYAGYGDTGIEAYGNAMGGYFEDRDGSGYAMVGRGDFGIEAEGNSAGALLSDRDGSGYAYVGIGDRGIEAYGTNGGGWFQDSDNSGSAGVGVGDLGINASGNSAGGYFEDPDSSGYGWVARFHTGAEFYADDAGVYTSDLTSGVYGRLAFDGSTTQGNGTKNFVQNHPEDPERVIVYSALEGDKAATYTRGRGKMENGRAVVRLGGTFRFVTNPDLGLTAHVTARGDAVVYVESVSTEELIVRGPADSDLAFDYIVYGLRIGFEDLPVVQVKKFDAYIPRLAEVTDTAKDRPDIARTTPRARFALMQPVSSVDAAPGAADLVAAIGVFDPKKNAAPARMDSKSKSAPPRVDTMVSVKRAVSPSNAETKIDGGSREVGIAAEGDGLDESEKASESVTSFPPDYALFPVSADVSKGDLLVVDPDGSVQPGVLAADRNVIGIAAGEAFEKDGVRVIPVAASNFVELKVDASFGAIEPGDLLCSSTTPGHAMRAWEQLPGTIVAKALSKLESGRGSIRVVLMLR